MPFVTCLIEGKVCNVIKVNGFSTSRSNRIHLRPENTEETLETLVIILSDDGKVFDHYK